MRIKTLIESRNFEAIVVALIVINAITIGFETDPDVMHSFGPLLKLMDKMTLGFFTIEVFTKLIVYRLSFLKSSWRIFDLIVVSVALIPSTGSFSVLRALRIIRILRLISVVPSLRKVIGGLFSALPGIGAIMMLLSLIFYIFSVMGTQLYGGSFPEWFGSIGSSAYSLFQIMTLESWSMGIVRPVMIEFPYAWIFFIVFIICTTFTVLNLFIGIIVSAIQSEQEQIVSEERGVMKNNQQDILSELKLLQEILKQQKKRLHSD